MNVSGKYTFAFVKSCSFLICSSCYDLWLLFLYSMYSFRPLSNRHWSDQCGFTCWFMYSLGKFVLWMLPCHRSAIKASHYWAFWILSTVSQGCAIWIHIASELSYCDDLMASVFLIRWKTGSNSCKHPAADHWAGLRIPWCHCSGFSRYHGTWHGDSGEAGKSSFLLWTRHIEFSYMYCEMGVTLQGTNSKWSFKACGEFFLIFHWVLCVCLHACTCTCLYMHTRIFIHLKMHIIYKIWINKYTCICM